ncbi:hypothetical protein LTR97_003049 [Elasticomyces elasticus]|uniref:Uncharacterized protein n=1 Tax=Elasticomyces elasticus TaxID=574655 RepID=A0AAN7ZPS6_9PEZI|nr:hypothetical protein LTR97_003049 [Elasticomyces elasticus]
MTGCHGLDPITHGVGGRVVHSAPFQGYVNAGTFINVSGNRIPRASSLEQHRHNVIDGFLSTLSGRTAAYRTEILQKPALYSWLKHQTDDDKCLTRYVYSHGWRITIQSWRESEVEQHSFRPGIRDRAQLQPPQVMRQPSQRPQFCSFAIVRSRRTSVICTTPSMAREDDNGVSRVEMTPAATVTASSGMATSTKKRSFMDRQDGATRVIWSSNEQLGITEPTPSKEPATKKPRTMPPTPDRVLVLPTDKLLLLSTD